MVGCLGVNGDGVGNGGAFYVYNATTGKKMSKYSIDGAARSDKFGRSVGLTSDTAVVGAPLHDGDNGRDSGLVYIFSGKI